jgi:hypothetical protein
MVWKWLAMYRDQGGYILTYCDRGKKRSSKEMDRCPLTDSIAMDIEQLQNIKMGLHDQTEAT